MRNLGGDRSTLEHPHPHHWQFWSREEEDVTHGLVGGGEGACRDSLLVSRWPAICSPSSSGVAGPGAGASHLGAGGARWSQVSPAKPGNVP